MVQLPEYSLCGPLGAPMELRDAPGTSPAQKLTALLRDAYRRLAFFEDLGEPAPEEELSYAVKLCALAGSLLEVTDRRDAADLALARATLLGSLAK